MAGREATKQMNHRFNETLIGMMYDIMREKGYTTTGAVIAQAVRDMHAKVFPLYAQSKRRPEGVSVADREAEVEKEQMEYCTKLGGTIEERDGTKVCVYFNYHKKRRFEQKVPLDRLSDILVRNQYVPSKDAVEKLQAEGKTDYKV